jgi:peptidyl-prolyl cis-trans isomerase A (cyclophilin A)
MALACVAALSLGTIGLAQRASPVRVVVRTEAGDIEIEIDAVHAPATSANFLKYVDGGHFEGARFHRTVTLANQETSPVKIEVIQGSVTPNPDKPGFPAIPLERTNQTGLKHKDGTISMARGGPDSATSSFFICLNDQPELDFGGKRNADGQGFAAFGQVVKGMDVVKKIHTSPANGQTLQTPIRILNIVRR